MVSLTQMTEGKRRNRQKNLGRKRKSRLGTKSTKSADELFMECGECGKPAPKAGLRRKSDRQA